MKTTDVDDFYTKMNHIFTQIHSKIKTSVYKFKFKFLLRIVTCTKSSIKLKNLKTTDNAAKW